MNTAMATGESSSTRAEAPPPISWAPINWDEPAKTTEDMAMVIGWEMPELGPRAPNSIPKGATLATRGKVARTPAQNK